MKSGALVSPPNLYPPWFQDMENESVCNIPSGKNRTTFSDVLLLSEIFLWNHENLNKRGDTVNKQVCWSNRLAKLSAM